MLYALSLLEVSQQMGVEVIAHGIYFPYGKNVLIKQLVNSLRNG